MRMLATAAGISMELSPGRAAAVTAPKSSRIGWRQKVDLSVHNLMSRTFLALALSCAIAAHGQTRVQPRIDPYNLELRIHELINAERASRKLRPLKFENRLAEIARLHSRDMVERAYFDHIDPDGKGPTARGRTRGYTCRKVLGEFVSEGLSENIFQNNLYNRVIFNGSKATYEWNSTEDIAESTVKGWMGSAGHRQNILNAGFQREGIGVYIAPNDQVLITQLFC
jgi:uncharacterized protein YkwD